MKNKTIDNRLSKEEIKKMNMTLFEVIQYESKKGEIGLNRIVKEDLMKYCNKPYNKGKGYSEKYINSVLPNSTGDNSSGYGIYFERIEEGVYRFIA